MFTIGVRKSSESQEYSFLQYIETTRLIDTVYVTLGCVCLRKSTDGEVDHNPKQSTKVLK